MRRGSRGSIGRSATASSAASSRTCPGKGKPLEGIGANGVESHHDEDWWLKAKLRRERLSYLPPTLAIRKEVEEALAAVAAASREDVVRRIVDDINERIRDVNRRGAEGPPSTVMPLDEDAVARQVATQRQHDAGEACDRRWR